MNYTDLIASRNVTGSIHSFVNYKKTPVDVVLEEAQALIYSQLRVREMRASSLITLPRGSFNVALPDRFLEAISLRDRAGITLIPNADPRESFVSEAILAGKRCHDPAAFTTLSGSLTSSATSVPVVAGSVLPATVPFPIVVDSEQMLVTAGAGTNTLTVTRGFASTTAAAHASGATVDGSLTSGIPCFVAIFDERYQFDCFVSETRYLGHVFYQTPAILSAQNATNFLTKRYPQILRVACMARAAAFMKDNDEWQARETEALAMCQAANAESDLGKAA